MKKVIMSAALLAAVASGSCYKFYEGLCPGPDSCMCTLKESCGSVGDIAKATNAQGGCSGSCHTVVHNQCSGDNSCLQGGAVCGGKSNNTAIECAQKWVDEAIPYCQCNGAAECCGTCPYCSDYRCDCSGYVSYCLGLSYGYVTSTLHEVTHPITKAELRPGDIMLYAADHVVFFAGWTDSSQTHYVCYQEPGCHTSGPHHAMVSVVPYPFNWDPENFLPYRLNSGAELTEKQKSASAFFGGLKTFNSNVKKQPLHMPDESADAIAPRELIERAAKTPASYPYKHEAHALGAAESTRKHLAELGITQL